ncbi:MAG: hypothetical protein WCR97_01395 [Bacilli bacterium]
MKEKDKKRAGCIYSIKPNFEGLEGFKQYAFEAMKAIRSNDFNGLINASLKCGEIYQYRKTKYKNEFCIILKSSNEFHSLALICPIHTYDSNLEEKEGYNIGYIKELSISNVFVAYPQDVRFINKKRFLFDIDPGSFIPKSITKIQKNIVFELLDIYKSLIENISEKYIEPGVLYTC